MTTAEIILAILGGVGGLTWLGNVIMKRIEAKNNVDLKVLDKDKDTVLKLRETVNNQAITIEKQEGEIMNLRRNIGEMQIKLNIIVPMLKKVLEHDHQSAELLKHLERIETAQNKTGADGN